MNHKISRNEKHKYSNQEKLALGENENTTTLINIAQENDSNIFELLQNLWVNNLRLIILKCSRFCLLVTFVFMVRKRNKKAIEKPPLPRLWNFSVFSTPTPTPTLLFQYPQLLAFDIFSNQPYYSTNLVY